MLEQKKKVIGNTKYLVTQLDGLRALKTQTKLIKILGPGVASILTSGGLDMKRIKDSLFSEPPNILVRFDDELVNDFVVDLFAVGVFKEDKNGHPEKVDFEMEFGGRINDMWKVALFVLEVNFFAGKSIMSSLPTTKPEQPEASGD